MEQHKKSDRPTGWHARARQKAEEARLRAYLQSLYGKDTEMSQKMLHQLTYEYYVDKVIELICDRLSKRIAELTNNTLEYVLSRWQAEQDAKFNAAMRPPEEVFLNSQGAADFLGISVRTLRKYNSILKPERTPGGHLRYSRDKLMRLRSWINPKMAEPRPGAAPELDQPQS